MNQVMFDFGDYAPTPELTMALNEQPPQRLEHFGARAVSDTELLAVLLQGNGTGAEQSVAIATRLMAEAGSLNRLLAWEAADYQRVKGIGKIKGLQLSALAEVARRMMTTPRGEKPLLDRPELVAAYMAPLAEGLTVEKFWALLLNRKSRLIRQVEITSGTATAALAHPREVFRAALRESAPVTGIVCRVRRPG